MFAASLFLSSWGAGGVVCDPLASRTFFPFWIQISGLPGWDAVKALAS